jgi:hypothetical protein
LTLLLFHLLALPFGLFRPPQALLERCGPRLIAPELAVELLWTLKQPAAVLVPLRCASACKLVSAGSISGRPWLEAILQAAAVIGGCRAIGGPILASLGWKTRCHRKGDQ